MKRQRQDNWLEGTPPPNRVASSPYGNDDYYLEADNHPQLDYNSDEGSPSKSRWDYDGDSNNRRSNSFGDAEDLVNTISGGVNNGGYYESFIMESSPPKSNGISGNLHHRHHHINHHDNNSTPAEKFSRYAGNAYEDESPHHRLMRQRAFLFPNKHHAIEQLHDKHYNSSRKTIFPLTTRSSTMLARWGFGIGLSFYLIFLMRSTHNLGEQRMTTMDALNAPDIWNRNVDCFFGSRHTRGAGCQQSIPSWYKEQSKQAEDALSKQQSRKRERRARTNLPTFSNTIADKWHHVVSLDEETKSESTAHEDGENDSTKDYNDVSFASADDLCGVFAQNRSLISPESYLSRAALNKNSRVLITGILNPVGLSLALHLRQHCGVQHVMGADAMFPNTVLNRLFMQDRIELLTSNFEGSGSSKPIILPFIGLDPKTKKNQFLGNEMAWMQSFKPTHVVHLASYSMDVYSDTLLAPEWKNYHSPYISNNEHQKKLQPYFYPLRSGMVSMEQLLQTIAGFPEKERPQFLYAANPYHSKNTLDNHGKLFRTLKRIDELLAGFYHDTDRYGLPSIGMRLPNSIYGPWGHAGSLTHDIMTHAVEEHSRNLTNENTSLMDGRTDNDGKKSLDLLFVDDAVDAIISALQYKFELPTKVTVPAERTTSVDFLSSAVQSLLRGNNTGHEIAVQSDKTTSVNQKELSFIIPNKEHTPFKNGLVKSLAWHMDRQIPFGSATASKKDADISIVNSPVETGDNILKRHEIEICGPYDISCHKNYDYLPCSSECNTHQNCLPSIFDDTRELIHDISEGCDIVMYTQMLGYNVEDAELHAEYVDDSDLDDDELLICNFAFVPRESDLVSLVTGKVPGDQLAKFGIEPRSSDKSSKDLRERTLDVLNGRLLYRGWILIWVKDGMGELSAPDASLLKLSPSKFFHPSVQYGLFVEDNFNVSPSAEDVLFLVDQMRRDKSDSRSVKKEMEHKTSDGSIIKEKMKFIIPEEPARRAAILFVPLRLPEIDDPIVEKYKKGRKLTIHDASQFMGYEVGYQHGEKGSFSLRRQREFYERIPSYVNKKDESRSFFEPWYQLTMKHWVRSRWVLHDFTLEEARLLRCDWYQEHVQWGNDLDQLSFAKVMGMRELQRRIAHKEPDDYTKTYYEQHPYLHDVTDFHEWHSMETEVNRLYREPVNWKSKDFQSTQVRIGANGKQELEKEENLIEDISLYVRIMSEGVMNKSRKDWHKMRNNLAKAKEESQKVEEIDTED